ncbi:MAG: KamA family protein [Pseudohongiellaceae bacterium]|jgi:KamA family protein
MSLIVKDTDAFLEAQNESIKIYTDRNLESIEQLAQLTEQDRFAMRVVSSILPFRVNQYVIEQLIDWSKVPNDPIYQLVFPQKDMLIPEHYEKMADLIRSGADKFAIKNLAHEIRQDLNPHPANQHLLNVPKSNGVAIEGIQHKYRETVLFFPSQGQTCHSYCTFCFRWAQFVGDKELLFASGEADKLHAYLKSKPEVTDLLLTGGDPMVMKSRHLEKYLLPLTAPEFDHVQTIRIGTKSLSFWPNRYVGDKDSGDILELLKKLVKSGKNVAFMAHFNHPQEMQTDICKEAIKRIQSTGAIIRTQAPLLAHINDNSDSWAAMWSEQVRLGMVPYYMFVERDTGAKNYFRVPLFRAYQIYREAMLKVSGLSRTARGPSMSAGPGKIEILGIEHVAGEKVFVLRFLQGRNPEWAYKPFFAKYDEQATWIDQLVPAFGESEFFYEKEYRDMCLTGNELL